MGSVISMIVKVGVGVGAGLLTACQPLVEPAGESGTMPPEPPPPAVVDVVINGAVIGPADQNGAAWDGPGLAPDDISLFSGLVVRQFPIGEVPILGNLVASFAGDLAASIFASFEPPDAAGTATVYLGNQEEQAFDLEKNQDTYTPIWEVSIPQVLVRGGAIDLNFLDRDLMDDDPIAQVVIDEPTLIDAARAQSTVCLDTTSATDGMVLRLFITVTPSPRYE